MTLSWKAGSLNTALRKFRVRRKRRKHGVASCTIYCSTLLSCNSQLLEA